MRDDITWRLAEQHFVELMRNNPEVLDVEHISLFAQNSEWDALVRWKNGERWFVDVTTGVRKKFNKPKVPGRFFPAFTKDNKSFDLFEVIYAKHIE